MPFYLWIILGVFDYKYQFVDEYYFDFGIGPGYSQVEYQSLDASNIVKSKVISGSSFVGTQFNNNWGLNVLASGSLGIKKGGIGSFGIGPHYIYDKIRLGINLMHISVYALNSIDTTTETKNSGENVEKSGAGLHTHVTYWFSNDAASSFRIKGGPSAEYLFLDRNNYMYALTLRLSLGYAPHHKRKPN